MKMACELQEANPENRSLIVALAIGMILLGFYQRGNK
jgi:hypothetical protein